MIGTEFMSRTNTSKSISFKTSIDASISKEQRNTLIQEENPQLSERDLHAWETKSL